MGDIKSRNWELVKDENGNGFGERIEQITGVFIGKLVCTGTTAGDVAE